MVCVNKLRTSFKCQCIDRCRAIQLSQTRKQSVKLEILGKEEQEESLRSKQAMEEQHCLQLVANTNMF